MTTEPLSPTQKKQTGNTPGDAAVVGLALVGILALLYFGYWLFAADPLEIYSDCKNVPGGVSCTITHTSEEPQTIAVCAEIKRICANGISSIGKGCFTGLVKPKLPGKLLVADSEFSNAQACLKVTAQTDSLALAPVVSSAQGDSRQ